MDSEHDFVKEALGGTSSFQAVKLSREQNIRLIKVANQKISLATLLNRYNIQFQQRMSASGWTHIAHCPFPKHQDGSPSFNFNPKEDRFNCFGCNSYGQAVEFLHYLQDRPKTVIAREFLSDQEQLDYLTLDLPDNFQEQISEALIELGFLVRFVNLKSKHRKVVEALLWQLDLYLYTHLPAGTVSWPELQARISKVKHRLQMILQTGE